MTKDEALKMAIEALEMHIPYYVKDRGCEAIKACKEALEQPTVAELNDEYLRNTYVDGLNQPAPTPVAWMHRHAGEITEFNDFQSCQYCEPLYTHPHQWQGLTDNEIQNELKKMWDKGLIPSYSIVAFARAIEQALKEKNT